jgi:hypothetical protein
MAKVIILIMLSLRGSMAASAATPCLDAQGGCDADTETLLQTKTGVEHTHAVEKREQEEVSHLQKQRQEKAKSNNSKQDDCSSLVNGCRQALKHLHLMMFKEDPDEQQCNNFARKSVQGFFHDFLSSWIEGSVLHELHTNDNKGLCKWGEYITALSDKTQCDPGSIIAMAGILGSEACGEPMMKGGAFQGGTWCQYAWDLGGEKPKYCKGPLNGGIVTILRGYPCTERMSDRFFVNGDINEDFTGLMLSSDPSKMDDFVERQTLDIIEDHGGFDFGNLEISAAMLERYWHFAFNQASLQAHNFGRVTCPIEGEVNGQMVNITPGFWNPRFKTAKGYLGDAYGTLESEGQYDESTAWKYKIPNLPSNYKEGMIFAKVKGREKLRATQCDWGTATMDVNEDYCPTFTKSSDCWVKPNGPVRQTSSLFPDWAKYDRQPGETDFNIEAGCCNLPGQAARAPEHHENPVDIGTTASFAPWDGGGRFGLFMTMHFFQNDGEHAMKPGFNEWQQDHKKCTQDLYLPDELANLNSVSSPSTAALDYFLTIAWDGLDSINSAWDNCEVDKCGHIPLQDQRLCGGSGLDDWMPPGAQ